MDNFNNDLIKKINNLVLLSKDFDENFKIIISLQDDSISEENITIIYQLTKNYILMRSEHGYLILLMDKLKNSINTEKKVIENTNDDINMLYNLSSFTSILLNINDLINNIDFQFKKIALKYPDYINMKPMIIILCINNNSDNSDETNKYINIIEDIKKIHPENIYKIIKCSKSKTKINLDEILEIDISIKINSLPSLYIINGDNIVEIPINKINDLESIKKIIK